MSADAWMQNSRPNEAREKVRHLPLRMTPLFAGSLFF
jgi:hypothetical protein